jgi:hypothetical protein
MEININNYESILIDYFDGNLNALEVAEVLLFLEQHPAIKNEFETLGTLPQTENISIDEAFKINLKKLNGYNSLSEKSFNELIISQIEGDCTVDEKEAIDKLIEGNKSLTQLKSAFLLTKLVPDFSVKYPNKTALKRKEAIVFYLTRRFAAAATLLLLASLLFLLNRNANKNVDSVELAQVKPIEIQKNETLVPTTIKEEISSSNPNKKIEEIQIKNLAISQEKKNINSLQINEQVNYKVSLSTIPTKTIASIGNIDIESQLSIKGDALPVGNLVPSVVSSKEDFLSISDWMKKKFIERGKNNLTENAKPNIDDENTLDPITIAAVGAGIVEKTTGKKVSLSRSFNKTGTIKSYTFAAGNFKFERIK